MPHTIHIVIAMCGAEKEKEGLTQEEEEEFKLKELHHALV